MHCGWETMSSSTRHRLDKRPTRTAVAASPADSRLVRPSSARTVLNPWSGSNAAAFAASNPVVGVRRKLQHEMTHVKAKAARSVSFGADGLRKARVDDVSRR
jgi:hypothetical protein